MTTNAVYSSPAAIRLAKQATQAAKAELDATPRHLLDRGNPNHPDNFNGLTTKQFEVGGVKFSAVRFDRPIPHWRVRTDENGVVFEAGAGGISNVSVPKMQASLQELLDRVSGGDVADFRRRLSLA
ncbi:hypothetical protein RQP54_17685 [Curvibacter sp. APW13]|uniref:hypothetical protein n=1 Tax=Curvibacter sp. APW13 TaxID=3077236 RepID=UPI0028E09C29|nr:hypothetical protein [Curvibacter sp. APW13]MDT8992708.1 hypothetical protein [Curvibacter sp. APW13]